MWSSRPSESTRKTFVFPELEERLARLRQVSAANGKKLERRASRVLYRKEAKDKISDIRERNKARTILVIGEDGISSPVVQKLLKANSNAVATFARSIEESIGMLEAQHYDMIYIVTSLMNTEDCSGPCFFSLQEDQKYADEYGHVVEPQLERLKPYHNGAELVVVCDGKDCPLGQSILNNY